MRPTVISVLALALVSCRSTCTTTASSPAPGQPAASAWPAASAGPSAAARPRVRPETKQACDACGGNWAKHGISETEGCICKTHDAGKICRDGTECEGQCLVAFDAKLEVAVPGPPPRGFYVGRCSEYETTFGCNKMIPSGIRPRGPQLAEDAAPEICID
jgi:hypothetical protein